VYYTIKKNKGEIKMKKIERNDQTKSLSENKNRNYQVVGVNCMFYKLDKCQYLGSASNIFNII
jgi:hypothetical protein